MATSTIDISNFLLKTIASKLDRLLMTNSLNAHSDASITVEDFCSSIVVPLINSLSLNYKILTMSEYQFLEEKAAGTFYIIKENGKIVRTFIGANALTDGETFFRIVDDFWQVSQDGGHTFTDMLDNSGKKVSAKGYKVIMRKTQSNIEYKYENELDNAYKTLLPIDDLKLKFADLTESDRLAIKGENVYLRKANNAIEWRIGKTGAWQALVGLSEIKGDKGDNVYLKASATDILWRIGESGAWASLISLEDIRGPRGFQGLKGEPGKNLEFKVLGSYPSLSDLQAAYPNGPAESGMFQVGEFLYTWMGNRYEKVNMDILLTFDIEQFTDIQAEGDKITVDFSKTPYAKVSLSGGARIFNLEVVNTREGNTGRILVFQPGFKQIAVASNIRGTVDLPLREGTVALLTYNRVGNVIYIRTNTIVGDVQYPTPQKVTDFQVVYYDNSSCSVQWTAPWANNIYDKVTDYDMRYSNSPVDVSDEKVWNGLKKVTGTPSPEVPGMLQRMTITGLDSNKEYYVYLKSVKVNYGVEYFSDASDFVYFRTTGSNDMQRAYRITLTERNLVPQLKDYLTDTDGTVCSIDKMVDEVSENVFHEDGYPDTANKGYTTFWSQYKYSRDTSPFNVIIDLFATYTLDKLFIYSKGKPYFSVYGMKDLYYEWEKVGEIHVIYNEWKSIDFGGKQYRFVKLAFDLMDFGMAANMPEGQEGFPEPEYNNTLDPINNLLIYGRPASTLPEGIMSPLRRSTIRKSADQFFCTNGHAYQQGRIHSMCSGEKMRMYIHFGHFAALYGTSEAYTRIADMRFKINQIPWISTNNGTGDGFVKHLEDTYRRYGLKPYLNNTGVFDYCLYNRDFSQHNRPCDGYWLPGAWRPVPSRGVGGPDKYFGVTTDAHSYKTYAKLCYAIAAKYGSMPVDGSTLFYPSDEDITTGLNLLSGIEPENEPDQNWSGWIGYTHAREYAALISASSDGHNGVLQDEDGNLLPGTKAGGMLAVSSGTAGVNRGYILPALLWWKAERDNGSLAPDVFSMHMYFSNTGNQGENSNDLVQYGITFEEAMLNRTGGELVKVVDFRNRFCPDREIWLTEFGWGESGARDTKSKYQCYSQPGRQIGSWVIPDRHRSDVKGAWIVRACLQMMSMGIDMVNYYSTECEGNYFGTGTWDTGAGFEMFHWNDCTDTTPGAKVEAIKKYEVQYARGGFSTTGLFGQLLGNGGYPITRAYWWVAIFRNRLKGYVFTGMKNIAADRRIVVACFKKQNEDKGAYVIYLNDNQNTGVAGVEIPVPQGVLSYKRVTVYVPDIPNPEEVPNTIGWDKERTGMPTSRKEKYVNGVWTLQNRPYYQNRYISYTGAAAVYPENPKEGDEVVVLPTPEENPYFPLVGPVQAKQSVHKNTLSAQQYEQDRENWEDEPQVDPDGNVIWTVKASPMYAWRQVDAICDYIDFHEEGIHGSGGDEVEEEVLRGVIRTNVSEFPEYYFFDAVPAPDYESSITDLSSRTVSSSAVELWWNNTSTEDTGYEIFVSSLPEAEYALLKSVPIEVENKVTISGLTADTTYYYKIRPLKGSQVGTLSEYISAKTFSELPVPTNLRAGLRTATSIQLLWDYTAEQVADFVYYALYRADESGVFSEITRIEDRTIHSYTDIGLAVGRVYKYKMRAVGLNGQSSYTNELETRTLLAEECSPVLQLAMTDKLGSRIVLTFDLPIGTVDANAKNAFTLTEDGDLRLISSVVRDESNHNQLIVFIPQDSLKDYDQKSDIRISYKSGGGILSDYGVALDSFLNAKVINVTGNYSNINAIYKLNLAPANATLPVSEEWNTLAGDPKDALSVTLKDTYGRPSSISVSTVNNPPSVVWGNASQDGYSEIEDVEPAVYTTCWTSPYGSSASENIISRLRMANLNNEYRYTIKGFGGTRFGQDRKSRLKVNGIYSNTISQLGNVNTYMVIENCEPVGGELNIDFINMNEDPLNTNYPKLQFVVIEEYKSNDSPENQDVWLRDATIVEDEGDGIVKFMDVTVHLNVIGVATSYRISETQDLTNVEWLNIMDGSMDVPYRLNDGFGLKTLYVQVKNQYNESNIRVIDVEYKDPYVPLELTNIFINDDDAKTYSKEVSIFVSKAGIPTHYRVSEEADLNTVPWVEWPDPKISNIPFTLSEGYGTKTVYLQIKDDVTISAVKVDTIQYEEDPIRYKEFDILIPLSELNITTPDEVSVEIPMLKYDKKMAFAYTMDDGKAGVYLYYMKHAKANKLCYTDGCGRDILFSFGSAWTTYNYLGIDLHNNVAEKNGMLWDNLIKMLDFGGGVYNHGGGVYDDPAKTKNYQLAKQSLDDNSAAILTKTGIYPYCAVVPGGSVDYMTPFREVMAADDNIYIYGSQSFGNYLLDVNALTDIYKFKHGRLNYDTYHSDKNLAGVKAALEEAYNKYSHTLYFCFSHNPGIDTESDIDIAQNLVYPELDWLYNTWGKAGNDSIWITCTDEIYEHIFMRQHSTITKIISSDNLVIHVKAGEMEHFRFKDICLKLKKNSGEEVSLNTVNIPSDFTGVNFLTQNDKSVMINLSYSQRRIDLAEKYTALFESSYANEDMEDAMYFVNALRPDIRAPYIDRIEAISSRPPVLVSVSINSGASSTLERDVKIVLTATGRITHYRISEDATMTQAQWIEGLPSEITYTLSDGAGEKTIYAQVKNAIGESEIKSSSIVFEKAGGRKAILSLGWGFGDKGFDEASKIYKIFVAGSAQAYNDTTNTQMGTFKSIKANGYSVNLPGHITGDNSGIYPDFALQRNIWGAQNADNTHYSVEIAVPAGTYKMKILCNIDSGATWASSIPTDLSQCTITANGITVNPIKVRDNTDTLVSINNIDASSGIISLDWYTSEKSKRLPINVIEIEEV